MAKGTRFALAIDGLVTLAMAATACSSGDPSSGPGPSTSDAGDAVDADAPFVPFPESDTYACGEFGDLLEGLHPGIPVDYIELRKRLRSNGGDPNAVMPVPGRQSEGTPCASTACRDALSHTALSTEEGWGQPDGCDSGTAEYLVYSRGENAGAVRRADLGVFLAPIDTLSEARLMLYAATGISLNCAAPYAKSGWRKNEDGSFEFIAVSGICATYQYGHYRIETNGTVAQLASQSYHNPNCVCGRRFEGLASTSSGAHRGVAELLAEMAYLEAASVIAFRRLEDELARLGAPKSFLTRARASRADEIRHARTMARLAKKHGGAVATVEAAAARERSVFEIALENAVEGGVREAYGALVAAHQAKNAQNPELRRAMQIIAIDEAKHAELAHDIEAWLDKRLTGDERARIEAAKADALADLERAALVAPAEDVRIQAGVPSPAAARALLSGLASLARAA